MLLLLIVGILDGIETYLRDAVAEWPRPLDDRGPRESRSRDTLRLESGYG
jgi:hypothetical protein